MPGGGDGMNGGRTRRIVIAGALGAVAALLGWTRVGFIPWFSGASLTIMHVPVIIGAVLEGPWVGVAIGFIFGAFSLLQAAIAPTGPADVWFTNPLLAVVPRLLIGPAAWLASVILEKRPRWGMLIAVLVGPLFVVSLLQILGYQLWLAALLLVLENLLLAAFLWQMGQQRPEVAWVGAGVIGSLTNTVAVLGMIGVLGYLPWAALPPIALVNGLPEAIVSGVITAAVVAGWRRVRIGSRKGADL
ncbi:MAG TPA: ECF transporter S component [Chloroflexi bacterium]|nr:ECF transporter S component [Chloroflexota bacterium]